MAEPFDQTWSDPEAARHVIDGMYDGELNPMDYTNLLDPKNSFYGLNTPVEDRPAALADLAEITSTRRDAIDWFAGNQNKLAHTALTHAFDKEGEF